MNLSKVYRRVCTWICLPHKVRAFVSWNSFQLRNGSSSPKFSTCKKISIRNIQNFEIFQALCEFDFFYEFFPWFRSSINKRDLAATGRVQNLYKISYNLTIENPECFWKLLETSNSQKRFKLCWRSFVWQTPQVKTEKASFISGTAQPYLLTQRCYFSLFI